MTLLSRVVAAGLIGALLGILDFVLFELHGNLAGFKEYVLYKPSLLGPSLLSFQLFSFITLGVLCFGCYYAGWVVLGDQVRSRGASLLLPLSCATLALGMIVLRFGEEARWSPGLLALVSRHGLALSMLLAGSIVGVLWAVLLERSRGRPQDSVAGRLLLSTRSQLGLCLILAVAAVVSPDVYALFLRRSPQTQKQNGTAPNILFVVMDTVRADHLSCYGYTRTTTPNIDRISRESLLFLNAFSVAPWTLPSHASMFTGLYPSQHHADWGHVDLDEAFPTLAQHLENAGYRTVGFSENPTVGRDFGRLARGFGEFHETWRRPLVVRAIFKGAVSVLHLSGRLECAERSIGIFEHWVLNNHHRGKPFFAFINFMAAHGPRYPRSGFSAGNWTKESLARIEPVNLNPERYYLPKYKLSQQELAFLVDLYDSDISYLDSQIGSLISFLADAGILDDTVVVLTSDHGENFGEHGFFEHQFCLYNTLLHVPLIVRYPSLWEPKRIEKKVSTVFLFNTVLALAATSAGGGAMKQQADPIAELQGQESVFAECGNGIDMLKDVVGRDGIGVDFSAFNRDLKCVIEGDYKFIWSSNGRHELYRIKEDFGETENFLESEQRRARALQETLSFWEAATPRKPLF